MAPTSGYAQSCLPQRPHRPACRLSSQDLRAPRRRVLPAPCPTTHTVFATFAIGRRASRLLVKVVGVSLETVKIPERLPELGE